MFWKCRQKLNNELIEFAFDEGEKLREDIFSSFDKMKQSATSLLSIFLAGGGAAFAMYIGRHESNSEGWIVWGLLFVSVYLFVLGGMLTFTCLMGVRMTPLGNHPANIYHEEYQNYDLVLVKKLYLDMLQGIIEDNTKILNRKVMNLNNIRLAAILTPVIFLISYCFY